MHDSLSPPLFPLPPFIPMVCPLSFLLLLLPLSLHAAGTVECHHSIEGSCTIDGIFGWCYHNMVTGEFNCDDTGYCAKKLMGLKKGGCFADDDSTHCCCNTGFGCSIGFTSPQNRQITKRNKTTTKCTSHTQIPSEGDNKYADCEDPFCYTYMSSVDEGVTSVWSGCFATTIVRYKMSKNEDMLYHNNSKYRQHQYLIDLPRCEDIVSDEEYRNGTDTNEVSKCMEYDDVDIETDSVTKKRMCCCRGKDNCNDNFGWNSPAVTIEQVLANKALRLQGSRQSESSIDCSLSLFLLPLLSLFSLHYFN